MKRISFIVAYSLIGWAICGTTVGVGRRLTDMHTTLVVHAIVAPLAFAVLSALFFRQFPGSSPARIASAFLSVVVALDALLVAPLFEHSFSMFGSVLGTWFPFALIFVAVFIIGRYFKRCRSHV
jgi:uncharacterized membrane protein YhdT